jgi:hypothetical protein
LTTQNIGPRALTLVHDILANYLLPSQPKLSYSGVRGVKVASGNHLEEGVITIHADFRTRTGVQVGIEIPVEVRQGQLSEPSVVIHDGIPRVIAQSTFDGLTTANTFYETLQQREMYAAPFSPQTQETMQDHHVRVERVNPGMFSLKANQDALRAAIQGKAITGQALGQPVKPENILTMGTSSRQPITMKNPARDPHGPSSFGRTLSPTNRTERDVTQPDIENTNPDVTDTNISQPTVTNTKTYGPPGTDPDYRLPKIRPPLGAMRQASPEDYDAEDRHEKPDPDRNEQDEDCLDPAERDNQDIEVGEDYSLTESMEVKERGGVVHDLSKGTKCTVLRDHAGDNKSFVVEFEDGLQAIVERHFLKNSSRELTPKKLPKNKLQVPKLKSPPKPCKKCQMGTCERHRKKADHEFLGKVNQEVEQLYNQGFADIDIKLAVRSKYGDEVVAALFSEP